MAHVTYKVVRHKDGWAYTVNGAFPLRLPHYHHRRGLAGAPRYL